MKRKLTTTVVAKTAPPAAGRLEIFDEYLPGFALRITPNGARSYVVRARVRGQPEPITLTIGDVRVFKLAEARQAAIVALQQMRRGTDPREAQRSAKRNAERERRDTFEVVAESFIAEHVSKLRSKDHNERDIRRYLISAWGRRPIASITTEDVSELIRLIVDAGKPQMATRVLAHTKGLFRWASAPGRARIKANPALALSARSDFGIIKTPRQVALSGDHLRLIWTFAAQLGEPFCPFFRMLLLCGQRRGEVGGMRWDELDLDREQVWLIPDDRMKAKRPHEVPLSPAMASLLTELRERRG